MSKIQNSVLLKQPQNHQKYTFKKKNLLNKQRVSVL